jgi:L-2-hydroxyglutarate oxidase LhgO
MDTEILIVGAGIIGLACAAQLSAAGRSVLVLERQRGPGRETTARSSEVIHAGLYYPPGSLKASCCVEGRRDLYARCERYQIPHRKLGKFVVACAEEDFNSLEAIERRARESGAGAVAWRDAAALARAEPRVRALGALWSPESGIVDTAALTRSYQSELEAHGGQIAFRTELIGLQRAGEGWSASARSEAGDVQRVRTRAVLNAAGLDADAVAALAGIDVSRARYRQHPCKGDYFAVAPALGALTRHLVYPVPSAGGLGIHVTIDLGGRYRLGPDAEYVEVPRYDVDSRKAEQFAAAARRYLPEIDAAQLAPAYAGVRPKLAGADEPFRDYVIEEGSALGAPGLVNLLGIESPGITAASAIARRAAALLPL